MAEEEKKTKKATAKKPVKKAAPKKTKAAPKKNDTIKEIIESPSYYYKLKQGQICLKVQQVFHLLQELCCLQLH